MLASIFDATWIVCKPPVCTAQIINNQCVIRKSGDLQTARSASQTLTSRLVFLRMLASISDATRTVCKSPTCTAQIINNQCVTRKSGDLQTARSASQTLTSRLVFIRMLASIFDATRTVCKSPTCTAQITNNQCVTRKSGDIMTARSASQTFTSRHTSILNMKKLLFLLILISTPCKSQSLYIDTAPHYWTFLKRCGKS